MEYAVQRKKKLNKKKVKVKMDGYVRFGKSLRYDTSIKGYTLDSDGLQLYDKKSSDKLDKFLFTKWRFEKGGSEGELNAISKPITSTSTKEIMTISSQGGRSIPGNWNAQIDNIIKKSAGATQNTSIDNQNVFYINLEWFIMGMIVICCCLCVGCIFGIFGCIGGYFIGLFGQKYESKYVRVDQDII